MKEKEEWLAFEWLGVYLYQLIVPTPAVMFAIITLVVTSSPQLYA